MKGKVVRMPPMVGDEPLPEALADVARCLGEALALRFKADQALQVSVSKGSGLGETLRRDKRQRPARGKRTGRD